MTAVAHAWRLPFWIAGVVAMGGCYPSCSNDSVSSALSGDGRYVAYKFSRNCGATTGFNVQISILERQDENTEAGNAFIADGGGPKPISVPIEHVQMKWVDETLVIEYNKNLRVFKMEDSRSAVRIKYKSI